MSNQLQPEHGFNPHIRNIRDGTVIKQEVNNGVYTMDMWICLLETGPVFSWQGQQVVKPLSTSLSGRQHCVGVKEQKCLKNVEATIVWSGRRRRSRNVR